MKKLSIIFAYVALFFIICSPCIILFCLFVYDIAPINIPFAEWFIRWFHPFGRDFHFLRNDSVGFIKPDSLVMYHYVSIFCSYLLFFGILYNYFSSINKTISRKIKEIKLLKGIFYGIVAIGFLISGTIIILPSEVSQLSIDYYPPERGIYGFLREQLFYGYSIMAILGVSGSLVTNIVTLFLLELRGRA